MFGHYQQLDKLRSDEIELERKVRAIKEDLKSGLDRSRHAQAVQLENYDILIEILRVTEFELAEINNKIYNLENSNY
jgi:uncharacterized protein YydD (DUF2326 family)